MTIVDRIRTLFSREARAHTTPPSTEPAASAPQRTFDVPVVQANREISRPTELVDFLAFIVIYGPDDYPEWLNLTNSVAFGQVFEALDHFREHTRSDQGREAVDQVIRDLHVVYETYEQGDRVSAAHHLQDTIRRFQRARRFIAISDA